MQVILVNEIEILNCLVRFGQQRKILKIINSQWTTKQVTKHMKRTWKNLSPEKTLRYRQMSDTDRTRYEKLKRLLKEGIKEGMSCACPPEEQPQVPSLDDRTKSDILMTTNRTCQSTEPHFETQPHDGPTQEQIQTREHDKQMILSNGKELPALGREEIVKNSVI